MSLFAPAELGARTEPVTWSGDVFAAFGPEGFAWDDGDTAFATRGIAARVGAEHIADALRAIAVDGASPVTLRAVGALPFDPTVAAELVIPAEMLTRLPDGSWWRTVITGRDNEPRPADSLSVDPGRFTVRRASDRAAWDAMVRAAIEAISRDALTKVVLARTVDVQAEAPFDPANVLRRLHAQNRGCYVFADATRNGVFLGASPELLVARRGSLVTSRPMAGTIAAGTSDDALHTLKHEHEHQVLVDAVLEALAACNVLVDDIAPSIASLSTVTHLATDIRGTATAPISALELARVLNPTPAVGGTPRDAALEFITTHEGFDRDRYAGPVGWVDANGDGAFAVALRCGLLDGANARLYAGAGIVAGSEPESEWAETQAKLEPMLRALVRP